MRSPYSMIARVPEEEQRQKIWRQTLIGRKFDTLNKFLIESAIQSPEEELFVESSC